MKFPTGVCCAFAAVALLLICGFAANPASVVGAPILVTAAPIYEPLAALRGGERFPKGAQILLLRDGKAEPLVAGFYASADANVSFDAARVLFAGKQAVGDPWQIWELTVADHSLRKVIAASTDAVRPLYLPGGRLVYAQLTRDGFQIEAAEIDGSGVLPLTYMQANALPVDVLRDGRILFEAGFPLGSGTTPELFLVYSDGSGVESYRCDHGAGRWGGRQLASGDVVFTHGESLARFTSPLAAEVGIATARAEYAGSIAEASSGSWLLSARSGGAANFALMLWKPGSPAMHAVLAREGQSLVEPVILMPHPTPNRHPSGLHDWSTANLLALDARQSREGAIQGAIASVRLEALDKAGRTVTLGTASVEADGSFFVKTPGDTPIRFALLDSKGATLRQEHGWFWIRRGEQRICVGCHAGPERAPENRVPDVLMRTSIPVDLSGSLPEAVRHATPGGN